MQEFENQIINNDNVTEKITLKGDFVQKNNRQTTGEPGRFMEATTFFDKIPCKERDYLMAELYGKWKISAF